MDQQYVLFRLNGQAYGAEISLVREVNHLSPITRLPNTPPYIEGVLDLRGEVLPVINLRRRLGLPEAEQGRDTRVMVMDLGKRSAAMIVDGVDQVVTLRSEEMQAPDQALAAVGQDYIKGVARSGDALVVIMDVPRLFGLN